MTRVVKSREYNTRVGYIPDEFSIKIWGSEEETKLEYIEVYRQSEAFFSGLSKAVAKKMMTIGWTITTSYKDGEGRINAAHIGTRKDCIGKMFMELTLQAKCFYENDDLLDAFNDVEVEDTWREDNL